jgi:hypothetical protein
MLRKFAANQNWARLTPWLGAATAILLFIFFSPASPMFWALINIPLYLFHQMEEHYKPGGFKHYVNQVVNKLPEGKESLTDIRIFWINILLVWVAFAIFGGLAFVNIGFGLLIIVFSLINCATHIGTALRNREWNPGLVLASIQFAASIFGAVYISLYGGIRDLFVWWIAAILVAAAVHILLFRLILKKL